MKKLLCIFVLIISLLCACSMSSSETPPQRKEIVANGFILTGGEDGNYIYQDLTFGLIASIPYDSRFKFFGDPPYIGETTVPDKYFHIAISEDVFRAADGSISICSMNVPQTFNWGYPEGAEQTEFDSEWGGGKMRIWEQDDIVEVMAVFNNYGHYIRAYMPKTMYADLEDTLMEIIASVHE